MAGRRVDRGSAGPFLVGQPLNLMRCEEVSLIPGEVPHGLFSSSSESHHLSSSTRLLQGDCWWQWLVFSGLTDLFCGHLPWIRVRSFVPRGVTFWAACLQPCGHVLPCPSASSTGEAWGLAERQPSPWLESDTDSLQSQPGCSCCALGTWNPPGLRDLSANWANDSTYPV